MSQLMSRGRNVGLTPWQRLAPRHLSASHDTAASSSSLAMMMASAVFEALSGCPEASEISFQEILLFIRLALIALPSIKLFQKDIHTLPNVLPQHIAGTLSGAIGWDLQTVERYWHALSTVIYAHPPTTATEEEVKLYNKHALTRGTCESYLPLFPAQNLVLTSFTAHRHIYPPVRSCQLPECPNYRADGSLTLREPTTHAASLFTLSEGALPVFTTSLYCRGAYSFPQRVNLSL